MNEVATRDTVTRRDRQAWRRLRSAGAAEGHPPCQRGLTIARRRTRSPCLRPGQAAGESAHHRIGRPIRRAFVVGGLLALNSGSLHTLGEPVGEKQQDDGEQAQIAGAETAAFITGTRAATTATDAARPFILG